jgi:hypothetical protein
LGAKVWVPWKNKSAEDILAKHIGLNIEESHDASWGSCGGFTIIGGCNPLLVSTLAGAGAGCRGSTGFRGDGGRRDSGQEQIDDHDR